MWSMLCIWVNEVYLADPAPIRLLFFDISVLGIRLGINHNIFFLKSQFLLYTSLSNIIYAYEKLKHKRKGKKSNY